MPRFADRRMLPYTPQQIFELVADIQKYPEFLPWCIGARILRRADNVVFADLIIGWKVIREKFTSKVTLDSPTAIRVDYLEGPMRYMNNQWQFAPSGSHGCQVDVIVDFEFKSKMLQLAMGALFTEAAQRMVAAFETRAHELYGRLSS